MNDQPTTPVQEPALQGEQPPQPSQPLQSFTPQPQPKKRNKKLIWGISISAFVVLLGAGVTLGYNLWYQNPDKVVHDAIVNAFVKAKTASATGTMDIQTKEYSLKLAFDGKANDSAAGQANVKADISIKEAKLDLSVKGSFVTKDDTLYFKLDNIRDTYDKIAKSQGVEGETPAYINKIIEKFDGKWISVKPSDYEEYSKEAADTQKCTTEVTQKFAKDKDMQNEVVALYKKHHIVVVDKKLGSKSIDGIGSLGYKVSISKDNTEAFIRGLADTKVGKALTSCDKSIDFKKTADDISKEKESADKPEIELWVSRFGHEITELDVTTKKDDNTASLVIRPLFNKSVTIDTPSDATSLKDVMKDIQEAAQAYYQELYGNYPQESDFDTSTFES